MKTGIKTKQILDVMYVLSWMAFIGLMIETGAILVSYVVSCINPQVAAENLYKKLDMEALRVFSFWQYSFSVSLIFAVSAMKAYVLYLVVTVLSKVNLSNPFKTEVVSIIEKISYMLFSIWVLIVLNNNHAEWLLKKIGIVQAEMASEEFIFAAGLVFIISQVFKRGVEIQLENDLTV